MDDILEQSQCDCWWVPGDVHVVNRPEITYMYSQREDRLYNSVLRVRAADSEHARLMEEVCHRHAHAESEWRLTESSSSAGLIQLLQAHGYDLRIRCVAYSLPVNAARPPPPDDVVIRQVQTRSDLLEMYSTMDRAFEREVRDHDNDDLAHYLRLGVGPDARSRGFIAYDKATDEPLCAAAFNSYPSLGVGFFWGGGTVPHARGRGIYSAITTTRMEHARDLGLKHVGLYAMHDTSAPIVAAQGFDAHGFVHFWVRPCPENAGGP